MRGYKFRGKHYYLTGVWVYGDLVRHACAPGYVFIGTKNDGTIQVIPETVGQFTGLHDKNGREVYEGDILQEKDPYSAPKFEVRGIVKEQDGAFRVTFTYPKGLGTYLVYDRLEYEAEVIGNIHENPELLEGK